MSGLDSFCVVSVLNHGKTVLLIIKYLLMFSAMGRWFFLVFQLNDRVQQETFATVETDRGACELRWSNHAVFSLWLLRGAGLFHHVRVTVRLGD